MILPEYKSQLQLALKKAQGTLSKVDQMIDSEEYCLKTVQMISAAEGLLRGAKLKMLENHLQTCGVQQLSKDDTKAKTAFVQELIKTLDISSRK